MENRCYLAMTAAEFQNCSSIPAHPAWLSCHFSPYTKGLSNVPGQLPPGAMMILDDANPICGHDPEVVRAQLDATVRKTNAAASCLIFKNRAMKKPLPWPRILETNSPALWVFLTFTQTK